MFIKLLSEIKRNFTFFIPDEKIILVVLLTFSGVQTVGIVLLLHD